MFEVTLASGYPQVNLQQTRGRRGSSGRRRPGGAGGAQLFRVTLRAPRGGGDLRTAVNRKRADRQFASLRADVQGLRADLDNVMGNLNAGFVVQLDRIQALEYGVDALQAAAYEQHRRFDEQLNESDTDDDDDEDDDEDDDAGAHRRASQLGRKSREHGRCSKAQSDRVKTKRARQRVQKKKRKAAARAARMGVVTLA